MIEIYYLDVPRANERIGSFVRESCRFVSLFDQSVAIVGHGNDDVTLAQIYEKGHPLNCVDWQFAKLVFFNYLYLRVVVRPHPSKAKRWMR